MIRLLSVLFLSLAVRAQSASYNYYGAGCGFGPSVPGVLLAIGSPTLGGQVTVGWTGPSFTGHRVTVYPVLATGISRDSVAGIPLPWRIPTILNVGGPNCDLLCSAEIVESTLATRSRTFDIPNDNALLGARLYQQYFLYYYVTGPLIFDFWIVTSGGEMVIGR